jgi:hypothetical protein
MNANTNVTRSDGPAAAAVMAAGIGVVVTGLLTTLAEASSALRAALVWSNAAGPLTGKTGYGVVAWLVAWLLLHFMWRDKEVNFGRIYVISMVLIGLGWILTFPPVFEAFGG